MSDLLRVLSDSDLLARTRELASLERVVTLRLLLHLNEIERRQLHLEQGYSSMFDYCTSGLGYSEPAAFRRIRSARCVARFPQVYHLLESNQVSLNSIARVARVLTEDNKDVLLAQIRGRSQREIEMIIAEYEPLTRVRDVVQPIVVRTSSTLRTKPAGKSESVGENLDLMSSSCRAESESVGCPDASARNACEKGDYFPREGDSHPTSPVERRVRFHFSTSESFQQKLDKVRALAWHRLPASASLEAVFELVLDALIERYDPVARHERRAKRATKSAEATTPAEPSEEATQRFIPAAIRDEVFARDGSRCAFVAPDGRRCEATVGLQVDHVVLAARGGSSTLDNLRLLCAHHNRYEAARLIGPHQT